ncbi:MAG: hypothetical protein INQ03_17485 [Candidatus Heimdallarchaeota archaeon]|nr:hypothetical protein [Candidatus Heimdallarchaeota archaeon]
MSESIKSMKTQIWYLDRFLTKHKDIDGLLDIRHYDGEKTGREIFEHAIFTLYKHSYAELHGGDTENVEFSFNNSMDIRSAIIDGYKRALDTFIEARTTKDMDEIVDPERGRTRGDGYATLAMHTMHHIGQAMWITNMHSRA